MKRSAVISIILLSVLVFSCRKERQETDKGVKVMAYYYTRWENFRPETLPYDKLTHIIFSFTEVIDNEMKFPDDSLGLMLKKLVRQRNKHPHIKIMVACGGWAGSGGFSEMARTPETRKKFVNSVTAFITNYKLDGLDIDWEYPGMTGIGNPFVPEDKENFTALMCELRGALNGISEQQVLTFAAAGWEEFFSHIELNKVMLCVNYINVMSYDLAGGEDPYTSHHTNLGWVKTEHLANTPAAIKMAEEGDSTKPFSTEKIVSYLKGNWVNPAQIVIGSNFSGRGWQGVPPGNNGLYQLNRGRWRGFGRYASIRENIEDKNGFVRYWDTIAKAPFLYNERDSIFISYDDTMSVRLKTKYAAENGLAGIMFWQLGADAPKDGLVDAIYKEKMKH